MYISNKTSVQISNLMTLLNLPPCARHMIERIAAEAAHDAHCMTAQACRKVAADMLVEQRHQIYEQLRRVTLC